MKTVAHILAFGALLTAASTANALQIQINPGATLSSNGAALAAFHRAAERWEVIFSDDVTVNIDADLASLGAGILGQAGSVQLESPFNNIRNAMVADADADDGIVSFLPMADRFSAALPEGFGLSGNLQATKANLKALGFTGLDESFGTNDATITFSSNFAFDFDASDGIAAGQFDFEGVAAHEIGHALGFVSIVDRVDALLSRGQTDDVNVMSLDLFRFRDAAIDLDPETADEFTNFSRWLVPGFDQIFDDLDNEWRLSTGLTFGDGQQASHFKDSLGIGLLDPTLAPGELGTIRLADIRTLDLIGWDRVVPEPSSLALLALGLGGLVFFRRRRRI